MVTISIKEETFGAGITEQFDLNIPNTTITLAELIQTKAAIEVRKALEMIKGKQPEVRTAWHSEEERILNRKSIQEQKDKQYIDEEKAGLKALAAFQNNAFFVFIDGEPKGDLQEKLQLTGRSKVQFLRLRPLVGG